MGTYPTSPRAAFLAWCQAHAPVFTANAANIGLTPAQATAFVNGVTAAVNAGLAQEQARQDYRVATEETTGAFTDLRGLAGDTVRTIRAFAENAAKPSTVYNLAQIPPPAAPSPAPPPAQPTDLTVELGASSGELTLRWKASNPAGTQGTAYIVRRKLPAEGAFTFVGVTGEKRFVDTTLFAGPDSVQYTVQGQRADSTGPVSEVFTVNFGRLPGGGLTASVQESRTRQPTLAA
ncbi:MAG: hypothetical protein HYX52_08590 [Chloroflexi bacterium]|nr:hypothetical protein [Chloroflexota bacterium]